jgi:hypothetical protein
MSDDRTDLFKTHGRPPKTPYQSPWDNRRNQLPRNIPSSGAAMAAGHDADDVTAATARPRRGRGGAAIHPI